MRIRGRDVQSPSGLAIARSARGPAMPRIAAPATGSPRSLSRSRRSVRARSRVMSGGSPPRPSAPVLVAVSRAVAVLRLGHGTSLSTPGAGSRGIRTGRPSRFSTRFAARSATGAVSRVIAR